MVKLLKRWMLALVAAPLCLALSSCHCDHTASESIKGDVVISKKEVKNGDKVFLSIGEIPPSSITIDSANNTTTIQQNISISFSFGTLTCSSCGETFFYNATPMVHYYIDDKEVGISKEYDRYFACAYTVSGLSVGEHTLSAKAVPLHENDDVAVKYKGEYTSTKFKVTAE